MARSDSITLLPLDRYPVIMGIPTTHFNQLNGTQAPETKGCSDIWDQNARDDLAWTMQLAEEMIAQELGFWESPTFITNEFINLNLPGVRSDWQNAELQTKWAYVECFGTETLTLLQANASIWH